jgi:hypothetical protein
MLYAAVDEFPEYRLQSTRAPMLSMTSATVVSITSQAIKHPLPGASLVFCHNIFHGEKKLDLFKLDLF